MSPPTRRGSPCARLRDARPFLCLHQSKNVLFGILLGAGELHLEFSWLSRHLSTVGLLNNFSVCEKVRSDFIKRWEDHTTGYWSVSNECEESVDKLSLVHLLPEKRGVANCTFPIYTVH